MRDDFSPLLPAHRSEWLQFAMLILGYIVLDWASYLHPLYALNITPWNPATALALLLILRFGRRAVLPLGLAILIADAWVRHLPALSPVAIGLSAVLALGYWAVAEALRRRLASRIFNDTRGLLEWAGIVIVGTLLSSIVFVKALTLANLVPTSDVQDAFFSYWVGDAVGALLAMPLFWMLFEDRTRAQLRAIVLTWESVAYLVATAIALWIAFGVGAASDFKYFYVLFLPVVWAAARQGMAGAVLSATIMQIGIIGSVQALGLPLATVLEIQALAAVLALFGFFIGVVVDEKQRVSAELRQTLRLAAAGEMAGALAHELNQPLTALSAYGMACEQLLERGETGERLRDAIRRMVAESHRAADVVSRLRDFFRTGATCLETITLTNLLTSAAFPFRSRALRQGVTLIIDALPQCALFVDRLQLEVVLRNLLSNAFDAVSEQASGERRIRMSAQIDGAGRVCVRVEDSGPGISGARAARLFEAFQSTKASGMGLGLVISRAIAEAHGGQLFAEVADYGLLRLVLPIEGKIDHVT